MVATFLVFNLVGLGLSVVIAGFAGVAKGKAALPRLLLFANGIWILLAAANFSEWAERKEYEQHPIMPARP